MRRGGGGGAQAGGAMGGLRRGGFNGSGGCLCRNDGKLEDPARLAQFEEREEVHALVLRLFQERVDPSVVSVHSPERAHVSQHSRGLKTRQRLFRIRR